MTPLYVRNSGGYQIVLSPTPPAPGLLPLGTMVQHDGNHARRGMIVAYNGDHSAMFYAASRYPYVVLWMDGYFEVYSPSSLVVRV